MPQIAESDRGLCLLARDVPLCLKRRGVETRLVLDGPGAKTVLPDPMLLKEIARAHRCFDALVSGRARSVADLATAKGSATAISAACSPLFFGARIVDAIVPGHQPPDLTAHKLIRRVKLADELEGPESAARVRLSLPDHPSPNRTAKWRQRKPAADVPRMPSPIRVSGSAPATRRGTARVSRLGPLKPWPSRPDGWGARVRT